MADAEPDLTRGLLRKPRLEAFSDGVFAIAITLLVLEIRVPGPEQLDAAGESLAQALLRAWPAYGGYLVSFAVIGIMWVNHHATFERVALVDRVLLFANLYLLAWVAFIPFPTGVLAEYLRVGGWDARAAAVLYSLTMAGAASGFVVLWWHLSRSPSLLAGDAEGHAARAGLRRALAGPAIYLLSVPLALVSPYLATVGYAAVAVFYVFAGGRLGRAAQQP